jgi:sugar phosphate isomerase/epimerase
MQIGAMNHPARDPIEEIRLFSSLGLDFVDLTLEPPCAAPWRVDPGLIRGTLEDLGMGVVGHTAFYLPLASPFESLRKAAVDELKKCIDVFAAIGARWMNVHPDPRAHFHSRPFVVKQNVESMRELIEHGKPKNVGLMVENIPGEFNNARNLGELLGALPELGLHLDIGHCNLLVPTNTTAEILEQYGDRIRHVHLHDNNGGSADLHLPLGVGTMDIPKQLNCLKQAGYDGYITLEVFSEDKFYLEYSRDVLRKLWT